MAAHACPQQPSKGYLGLGFGPRLWLSKLTQREKVSWHLTGIMTDSACPVWGELGF